MDPFEIKKFYEKIGWNFSSAEKDIIEFSLKQTPMKADELVDKLIRKTKVKPSVYYLKRIINNNGEVPKIGCYKCVSGRIEVLDEFLFNENNEYKYIWMFPRRFISCECANNQENIKIYLEKMERNRILKPKLYAAQAMVLWDYVYRNRKQIMYALFNPYEFFGVEIDYIFPDNYYLSLV